MEVAGVITAGGRVAGEFESAIGTPVKALARVGDATMLDRAVGALRGNGVERIAVVGPAQLREVLPPGVRVVDEAADGAENLRLALRAWDSNARLLYLTSDMPFVTPQALRAFVDASPPDAVSLPLTEWPDFERRFSQAPQFGITLAGEKVVNGGAFLIPPGAAERVEAIAMRFFDARKSPFRMARLTGATLLLQFVFRRLSIARLEEHAQRLLEVPAKAVRHAPAELAYDVDTFEEYRYAVAHA